MKYASMQGGCLLAWSNNLASKLGKSQVLSQMFETVMGAVIVINIILMIVETNADASCYTESENHIDIRDCSSGSYRIQWLQIAPRMPKALKLQCRFLLVEAANITGSAVLVV